MVLFITVLSALLLIAGLRFGVIAIHGGSVTRAEEPILFWMGMSIPMVGLIGGTLALLLGW
jgi:hypothetical protein